MVELPEEIYHVCYLSLFIGLDYILVNSWTQKIVNEHFQSHVGRQKLLDDFHDNILHLIKVVYEPLLLHFLLGQVLLCCKEFAAATFLAPLRYHIFVYDAVVLNVYINVSYHVIEVKILGF